MEWTRRRGRDSDASRTIIRAGCAWVLLHRMRIRGTGGHHSVKTPLISPSFIEPSRLHSASSIFSKSWLDLHVDSVYEAPFARTLTSPGRYRHARFLGLKEAAAATVFSRHDGTAVTMSPHVPLFVQVSEKKYGFRSDYLCLVVLPCPRTIVNCIGEFFSLAEMLSLSDDVE